MKLTGIILAGGKSSRMGTDKGLVLINGKPMIQYIIETLKKSSIEQIIIISNNPDYRQFNLPVYPDIIKDKGPLSGIYTGLHYSSTAKNLVVSCDVPFIKKEFISLLVEKSGEHLVSVLKYKERVHYLIGVYDSELCTDLGESIINNQLKVQDFNACHNVNIIDLEKCLASMDEQDLLNINSSIELNKISNEVRN